MGKACDRTRTHHIKNTRVVCHTPKTLYGMPSQWFLIHSFSTLLITFFLFLSLNYYIQLFIYFSSFMLLLSASMQLLPVKHIIICRTLYKGFFRWYMQQEIQQMLQFCISFFDVIFFLNLCSKLLSMILRNYKKSN